MVRLAFASDYSLDGTGISRYQRELIKSYGSYSLAKNNNFNLGIFTPFNRSTRPCSLDPTVHFYRSSLPGKVQRYLNHLLPVEDIVTQLNACEVLHSLDPQFIYTRLPWIVTVHDVAWRRFGGAYASVFNKRMQESAEKAIKCASHIVAISKFTADELIAGGTEPSRISVIYQGVNVDQITISTECNRILLSRLLPERYVMYAGTDHERKNLSVISSAYSLPGSEELLPCVMAGPVSTASIAQLKIDGKQLRHLGYLSDGDLAFVMKGASALLFPSLYEGFGRPLVEAMALGIPVIAARIPVFTEVAEGAALFFDIQDHHTAAQQLLNSLILLQNDNPLACSLVQEGLRRAEKYSWKAACAQLHDLYNQFS